MCVNMFNCFLTYAWTFQSEFDALYKSKISGLPLRGSGEYRASVDIYEKNYVDALKETEAIFTKRGHDLAQIANPDNGKEFFTKVISYRGWSEKTSKFSISKLTDIASAHIPNEE